jgi:hypothetical protein
VLDQEENIENVPGSAITVGEGVDSLELAVLNAQTNQRVEFRAPMHELSPVMEFLDQELLPNRRRINGLTAHTILQRGPRFYSNFKF